jgi:ABC-type sulfate transport system substrate-binding protein
MASPRRSRFIPIALLYHASLPTVSSWQSNGAKKPGELLPKVVEEFLRFALSKEGQEIVVKDGFDPLTAKLAKDQLKAMK